MKKLFLLIAVVIASVTAASAQWGVGARLGSGFQGVAQYYVTDNSYAEVRLGMDWVAGGIGANFSALYNWRVARFNWTSSGEWFFDAGTGLYVGGAANVARIGVHGVAKLGYTFEGLPLSLAFDFSPSFGPAIWYGSTMGVNVRGATFDRWAICNLGISAVYRF